jgi:hypothetical protein
MSCNGGRVCFRVCSASKASLVQVRAMSLRMTCTRGLEAPSANFSHSAARILQSSEFNIATTLTKTEWGQSKNSIGPPSSSWVAHGRYWHQAVPIDVRSHVGN